MRHIFFCIILTFFFVNGYSQGSWLSKISGIHINLNKGTFSVSAPDLGAIPGMIKNLPKDVSQAMLNPNGVVLASAIRFSKGQAQNRGTQPIPANIKQQLSPYFPPNILNGVTWTTANGISIDGILKNWLNEEGAVTLDNVICFSDGNLINDLELWAHELTHVIQYDQMGVETFAFYYSMDWNSIESQARSNASNIIKSINSIYRGELQSYQLSYNVRNSEKLNWNEVNSIAKSTISPVDCIWINNQNGTTGNNCPIGIYVTNINIKNLITGNISSIVCNQPSCFFPPGASGPLLSPYGHIVTSVNAAYEVK